ncbi:MAG: hypothetical protein N2Z22_09870 [Turneriella sp.]|nr:hypothetical protein [Turneriella sp.]
MQDLVAETTTTAIIVNDRSSLTAPNSADLEILSKLDEKLRFIEAKKINANDPTYYLALEHVSVANPTALENAIKKVTDLANGGKNRVAYLYPMLIAQGSKPAFQLFLFYPPKNKVGVRDAAPLRRAAFARSEPLIRSLLEAKRTRPTEIDEEHPGAALLKTDAQGTRFYPEFYSLEYDFRRMLKKAFDKLEIGYIEIPDFFEDLKAYFAQNPDLVERIGERYHIVIDQLALDDKGEYMRVPEVIRHYRIIADGLEKLVLNVLYDKAQKAGATGFVTAADNYKTTHVATAVPGRRQSKEKVDALMELAAAFPADRITDKEGRLLMQRLHETLEYLRVLIEKKDRLVERKQKQTAENLLLKIENLIQSNTKQNLDLLQIDLYGEILRITKDEAQAQSLLADFERKLMQRFGALKTTAPGGTPFWYFVDQRYMSSVLENLSRQMATDGGAAERYEIATQIYEQLSQRKDPALDQALTPEERMNLSQLRAHNLNVAVEKKRLEESAHRYNIPQGILVSMISAIIFAAALFYSLQLFWLAFPLTLVSIISFYRIRFRSGRDKTAEEKSKNKVAAAEEGEGHQHQKRQSDAVREKIAASGAAMVFPYMPKKFSERVLTEDEFRQKVRLAAPELKRKLPELANLSGKELEQAVYEALREESVCIVVPPEIVKKSLNKVPPALYIDYKDFASDQVRSKIAEEFRAILKPHLKDYEQEFYRYLINTLELKYYTYLKKNLKK